MIFITVLEVDYIKLDSIGSLSMDIFRALNHAIKDLQMDCKRCSWKVVCDQVEGMKEMYQKNDKRIKEVINYPERNLRIF